MERLARVFNVCCKVKSLSKKIPYSPTQNLMTHLLLIVFFRWRSFIFRFDDSFFILPQIIYFTLNNIHLLSYPILGPWFQFSCARGEASQKNRSVNANFTTAMQQFQYFLGCSWPNKKQEPKHKTCPTLITLTIKYHVAKAQIWVPFDQ